MILLIPVYLALGIIFNTYALVLCILLSCLAKYRIHATVAFLCITLIITRIQVRKYYMYHSQNEFRAFHKVTGQVEELVHIKNKTLLTINSQNNTKYRVISLIKSNTEIMVGDIISTTIKCMKMKRCHSYDYDFAASLMLHGISFYGFAIKPIQILEHRTNILENLRYNISSTLQTSYNVHAPLAIALTTGSRSLLSQSIKDNFARNGLSHLLAISGLHISIVIYTVYYILNKLTCLICPYIVLRFNNIYKILLIIAWLVGLFYVFISGCGIPAIRTIIMSGIIVAMIILDRRVVALRSVAIAASIILIAQPDALYSPSFQMSFVAVTSLIYFRTSYSLYSTLIASTATIPFAIYHFHKFATYSVLLNMLAIPLTTFVIMPMLMLNILCICLYLPSVYICFPLQILEYIASLHLPYSTINFAMDSYALFCFATAFMMYILLDTKKILAYIPLIACLYMIYNLQKPIIFIYNKTIGVVYNNQLLVCGKSRSAPCKWSQYLGNIPIRKCKDITAYLPFPIFFKDDACVINGNIINNFDYIEIYPNQKYVIGTS